MRCHVIIWVWVPMDIEMWTMNTDHWDYEQFTLHSPQNARDGEACNISFRTSFRDVPHIFENNFGYCIDLIGPEKLSFSRFVYSSLKS